MKTQHEKMRTSKKKMKSTKFQTPKNPEPSLWSQLPTTVVVAIYTYLGDIDRVAMARVCKTWYQGFHVPALWRKRVIDFSGGRRTKRGIKEDALYKSKTASPRSYGKYASEFVKKFSTSLQDIEMTIIPASGLKEIVADFKEFAECLDSAKLRSICIVYFGLVLVRQRMRMDLIDSLKRLIHNQHCLRKFRIKSAHLDLESGLQVIQYLADASAATIEDLSLNHFFEEGLPIYREERVLTEMQKFTALSCIHLDYHVMSEELAKTWVTGCPNLSLIKLCVEEYVHPSHVISCETWRSLVSTHPNLLVELQAFGVQDTKQMLGLLSPAIPMFDLTCSCYEEVTTEFELTKVLHRVVYYHRTIKHLSLSLEGHFPNLDTAAVQKILSKCTNLWQEMPPCRNKKTSVDQDGPDSPQNHSKTRYHKVVLRRQPLSWSNIPAIALCKVFQSLSDMDRVSLAQVCTSYYEVFHTPSLWRSRFIEFDRRKHELDIEMETMFKSETGLPLSSGKCGISFAQRFRSCLQDLHICVQLIPHVSREILRDFPTLSENSDGPTLANLEITYSGQRRRESTRLKNFIRPLNRLVRNQHNLKNFAMYLSYLDVETGLNFLNCLAQSAGSTLEELSLNNLFTSVPVHRDARLVTEMQKFTIRSISIDYAILSEELVDIWAQGYPTLSYIKLWAVQRGHEIGSQAWKDLRATHPSLLVEIWAQKIQSTDKMLTALSQAKPVCKLLRESEQEVTSELRELFGRLAVLVSSRGNNEAVVDAKMMKWNWKVKAMNVNKRVRTSTRWRDNKTATKPEAPSWGKLPTMVLIGIFQYLGDADRVSMARVCKSFYEVFRTPALWRSRVVEFGRRKNKREIKMEALYKSESALPLSSGKSAIIFARIYRHCLQDLDICVRLSQPVDREIISDFTKLAEALDDANLQNVKLAYYGLMFLESQSLKNVIKPLYRFIRHQHNIKKFAIQTTYLELEDGLHFLNCLAKASGSTLEELSLNNFFANKYLRILRGVPVVRELQKFTNIRSISIDYAILSEDLVGIWAQGYPTLSYIKLWAVQRDDVVSDQAWGNLMTSHPSLLVEIFVHDFEDTEAMLPFLSPDMPVCKLIWELEHGATSELTMTRFLHRVASYHRTIRHLFVRINGKCKYPDTLSVESILSNCINLLPFACRNFSDSETESNTWILSQDNRLLPQNDI